MLEKYLQKVNFDSLDDFRTNFKIKVPDNFNFGYDVVDEWARNAPHKLALLWTNDKGEEHRYTFADMKRMSDRVASFYLSLGIEKGDKVMMMLKRRIEFWFSIIALHKIGAVAIPATHLLTAKDIIYRSNAADIKMIVCADEPEILRHVEEALPDSPTVSLTVATGSYKEGCWLSLDEGISGAAPFVRPQHVNENRDMSLLYFTSGSSGNPKMAAHNYLYPLGHIVTAKYWHNLNENSLHLTIADTGWGKAVWGKLYGQWLSGAAVFVYDHEKFIPADILAVMAKYRITSFCAPPTIYRYLIREDFSKYDLSALEYCTTAGEPLNPSVFECWKQLTGLIIHEGFGQTETTMTIGTFPWMEPKPGSLGVPNPAYDMDLLSQDGRSAEDGENGEIIIRTDKRLPVGLFEEYYRDAEHLYVTQTGKMVEVFLYLSRIYILSTPYYHVLYAARNAIIAILIPDPQITGMEITVFIYYRISSLGVFVITFHHIITLAANFTLGAARNLFVSLRIDYLDIDIFVFTADCGVTDLVGVINTGLGYTG
jgi:acetyl-CoA synthetase